MLLKDYYWRQWNDFFETAQDNGMKKLLTDTMPFAFQLEEAEAVDGIYKLKGLFHLAERKNANGRIYRKALLEREIGKIMPMIQNRQVVGELDHPMDPSIKLQGAAHVITDLKMDGNKVYGILEALKTPMGLVLEGLIKSGVKLGISSRGVGSLQESNGIKYVQEDYGLITWDVVPNPSTPDAWLSENELFAVKADTIQEKYSDFVEFGGETEIFEEPTKIMDMRDFETLLKKKLTSGG